MKSINIFRVLSFALVAVALLAANAGNVNGAPAKETIAMYSLSHSGQTGFATLTDQGGKVLISVKLTGEPATAAEPAHVHLGHCPTIKAVPAYNVGPILNGKASRVVDLSWADINSGKYALNVHESAANMGTYMSCGNIGMAAKT